jgi:glycosyltransferase involved in cell wall biosynthesis
MDSICSQTLEQLEIICVDDGSADATLEILHSYQEKDPRVRVIQQKNAGAGAARNVGLDCASGNYLSFLDADDFFEPDMLEKAVAAAEKWQADYVVFRSDRYYSDRDCFEAIPWSLRREDLPPYMPFSYRQLTGNVFLSFVGWAWDKLFRRSFVLEHQLRFQEQRTTNDMLFVFSALVCARRIAAIQDVLAHQRRGSGDTLSVTREKSWHCFYNALLALRERLIAENVYWELEKDFINYSLHFSLWHLNSLAEPSHTLLKQKLLGEWFAELGIDGKPESYFYNFSEYTQYQKLRKGRK